MKMYREIIEFSPGSESSIEVLHTIDMVESGEDPTITIAHMNQAIEMVKNSIQEFRCIGSTAELEDIEITTPSPTQLEFILVVFFYDDIFGKVLKMLQDHIDKG